MCLEDYQIGRLIRAAPKYFTVLAAGGVILLPNKDRVAVGFYGSAEHAVTVCPEIDSILDQGIVLTGEFTSAGILSDVAGSMPNGYHFSLTMHGDLPTRKWHGVASVENTPILIIEYFLPEEVLRLTPEQLRQRA
jgi:hypothetical protein